MPSIENPPLPIIIILGPTGVGKTDLAIHLAENIGSEVVSADSRYFYRGMDIGTAKPTLQEMRGIPHHLIDVCNPDETWSLALFQRAARNTIADIHERGKVPIVVGGTGQYVQAVLEEWSLPNQPPDERMRQVLTDWAEEIGPFELHKRLHTLDAKAAEQIDPRNLRRTVRAMEVIFHSGRLFSTQRQREESPYRSLRIGLNLPRPQLYDRIDSRIEKMISKGLLEEVKGLLSKGYSPELPAFSAIGYQEMIQVIKAEINMEEAVVLMKRRTRQFIRRQGNWFKANDPDIHWFIPGTSSLEVIDRLVRSWM